MYRRFDQPVQKLPAIGSQICLSSDDCYHLVPSALSGPIFETFSAVAVWSLAALVTYGRQLLHCLVQSKIHNVKLFYWKTIPFLICKWFHTLILVRCNSCAVRKTEIMIYGLPLVRILSVLTLRAYFELWPLLSWNAFQRWKKSFQRSFITGLTWFINLPPVSLLLFLLRSGSKARGESRALEGHHVSSKSPSRVRDRDKGVAGRNGRELCLPEEGSLICLPGKLCDIFYLSCPLIFGCM